MVGVSKIRVQGFKIRERSVKGTLWGKFCFTWGVVGIWNLLPEEIVEVVTMFKSHLVSKA